MTISYVNFMKHAKKVTKTAGVHRQALTGVYHDEKGGVVVTDSHRMYYASNVHKIEGDAIITPDGAYVYANYPIKDIKQFTPDMRTSNLKLCVNIDDINRYIKLFKPLAAVAEMEHNGDKRKKGNIPIIVFNSAEHVGIDVIPKDTPYDMRLHLENGVVNVENDLRLALNAKNFIEALEFLKDSGKESFTFYEVSNLNPCVIKSKDDEVVAVISPVRLTQGGE